MNDTEKQRLCRLVKDGEYKEVLMFFQNSAQDHSESVGQLAKDVVFDAATKFRDNDDPDLKALVELLFDAIHPELLRFRICFNFITGRSSSHLDEVLISQLRPIVNDDFRKKHTTEWLEFRDDLPSKLAKRMPAGANQNLLRPTMEAAHILFSFKEIPFTIPQKLSETFAQVVHDYELEMPSAFPLLAYFSISHPFSPKLLGITSPIVLVPTVYNRNFLARRLMEGLKNYLDECDYNYEHYFVKPVVAALDVIVDNLEVVDSRDIEMCCSLVLPLLQFVGDFDQHSFRVPIMNKCQQLVYLFPSHLRCILFKDIISLILEEDFDVENEATLIAWFVDLYRRCLDEEPFRKELGSFLGLLDGIRYNDMINSSNYYSSVFCLIQTIAIKRFNLAMLQEVETRLIESIHAQIKDYIQMEELREKDKQKFKETVPKFPNDVTFGPPPPEGSVVEQLQLLMFGCEQARKFIAEARNCER